MRRIRLSANASVTPTEAGVILRSDLGTFQLTGADVTAFLEQMVPLLDGSRDQESIIQGLAGYSPPSVAAFLEMLEQRQLVEAVPETAARWRGQEDFFRRWPKAPVDAMQRLARARVLVVGLEPWGTAAAVELSAAGLGMLYVIDDGAVGPRDVSLTRWGGEAALAAPRREAVAAMLGERAPWCRVEESPMEALDDDEVTVASGPWSVLVVAVPPGDAAQVERVARAAHRAGIASLWSHVTGTNAVLGPLVTPGKTACRVCATVDVLNPGLGERSSPAPAPQGDMMGQLLGHRVAMEAIRMISGYAPSDLGGRLVIEDHQTFETSLHTLVRFPRCRVCGDG